MSDPTPHLEELAALHAVGLLDEAAQKEHLDTANPEVERLVLDYAETAALLAHDAPMVPPSPELKKEILRRLSTRRTPFSIRLITQWIPYAIAICLMAIGMGQTKLILDLQSQLLAVRSEISTLRDSNALIQLRLTTLEAKDPAYLSAKVLVAWDPHLHRGVVSVENLPAAPTGQDYQLWVLDPTAEGPINAGVIVADGASHRFAVRPVSTENPGFAVSLEPTGGQSTLTGPILFAVAPGPQ